jgi:hypothetical protein
VDTRVQGLDPAAEHLGALGQIRDIEHLKARVAQGTGGAPGCNQLNTEFLESTTEFYKPGLV